jgi:outer membrane lipoprotein-sorting protein
LILNIYARILTVAVALTISVSSAQGQEILTAVNYLDRVADRYGGINDYIADIIVTTTDETMSGTLYYRRPNLIRIDFAEPPDQVLVSNGSVLTVYVPRFDVVLQQALRSRDSGNQGADLASEQGLQLMRQNYSVAYLESPDPAPLEEGADELAVTLKLDWRSTSEQYRQLTVSVTDDFLIRRIVGVTVDYQEVQFDFTNIRVNQNIPPARFEYDPPASANVFDSFLFDGEG